LYKWSSIPARPDERMQRGEQRRCLNWGAAARPSSAGCPAPAYISISGFHPNGIMALHAELHRHLGGSVVPRIFWRYLVRNDHPLAAQYPTYESFEAFFTRPRASLTEYLELHTLVEQVQRLDNLPYFVSKLVRGAYVFESICYLELRHTPYYRTDP